MGITQEFDEGLVSTCVSSTDSFPCNANNGLTVVSFSLVTAFSAVLVVGMLGKKVRQNKLGRMSAMTTRIVSLNYRRPSFGAMRT